MEARIVGPEEELGEVYKPLVFFGNPLTREWSEITVNADQLKKLEGNRYVELRGDAEEEDTTGPIRARLDELGVSYAKNASAKTLSGLLDKAEKAAAKADAEAAEAEAEAQAEAEAHA